MSTNTKSIIFVVSVQYSDEYFYSMDIFGTFDKDKAEKWCKRYNRIITDREK